MSSWDLVKPAASSTTAAATGHEVAVAVVSYLAHWHSLTGTTMRAEWWDRAEWALDQNPERQRVGLAALEQLGNSCPMGKEDAQILAEAKAVLGRA